MLKQSLILTAVLVGMVVATLPASAGEMSGSGHNMFVPKVLQEIELPDGIMANRILFKGFMNDDTAGSPLGLASMQCSGTTIASKDGSPISGGGTCDSIDKDGDLAFYWWHSEGTKGKWGFLGGTGKWKGVEGGGTYEQTHIWLDGKMGNNWQGTWTLK